MFYHSLYFIMERGKFVLFEGGDRCGKTTQARRLVEHLNKLGSPSVLMQFPNRATRIGTVLDSYLTRNLRMDDRALYLMFVANRWEQMDFLHTHLNEGTTVVADRFSFSGVAYSKLEFAWCVSMERGLPKPDITLLMDMHPSRAQSRDGWGVERFETQDIQHRVRSRFERMRTPEWHVVDATPPIDVVSGRVQEVVDPILNRDWGALKYMR
jgi:dTMP kinase